MDEIRRGDGNLENGIVSWDSLDADVQRKIEATDSRLVLSEAGQTIVLDKIVTGDIAPESFASRVEAETGVANDKIMTPLRSREANVAQRPYASQSQAQAGTDNSSVLTPLRGSEMLTAQRPYASQAEAEAGTHSTSVLSPERGKQMLDALRTAHSGSASLTWGEIAAGASASQTLTVAGAVAGDRVVLGLPPAGVEVGLIAQAWVSNADVVTVRITNVSAAAITPHSGAATEYNVTALRY